MTKFAKYLSSHCVSEWSTKYVQYKTLKKAINQIKKQEESLHRSHPARRSSSPTYEPLLEALAHPLNETLSPNTISGSNFLIEEFKQPVEIELTSFQPNETSPVFHNQRFIPSDDDPEEKIDSENVDLSRGTSAYQNPLSRRSRNNSGSHTLSFNIVNTVAEKYQAIDSNENSKEVKFLQDLEDNLKCVESFYREQEKLMAQQVGELLSYRDESDTLNELHRSRLQNQCKQLYRALLLLHNYRILNYIGICKILKKHDKNSQFAYTSIIKPILDESYFFASALLKQCIEEIVQFYAASFESDHNIRNAINELQPQSDAKFLEFAEREWAAIKIVASICIIGLFAVLIQIALVATVLPLPPSSVDSAYAALTMYRVLGMLLIHCCLWEICTYYLHKTRVNYVFILGINPDDHHLRRPQQILALLFLAIVYIVSANLYLFLCQFTAQYPALWNLIFVVHFCTFLIFISMWAHPFKDGVHTTRTYFYGICWRIIRLPFAAINFEDTFVANQGTSLMHCMPDLAYALCFYFHAFIHHTFEDPSESADVCSIFQFNYISWWLVALPNYWRFVQCLKRYLAGAGVRNLGNAFKYGNRLILAVLDALHGRPSVVSNPTALNAIYVLWVIFEVVNAVYSYYWDVVHDWGLFQSPLRSKHPLLRAQVMIDSNSVYYGAIIMDMGFRVVNAFTISPLIFFGSKINSSILASIFYELESLRRSLWNYFRVEHEHIHNVCKFRAVDIIPLSLPTEKQLKSVELAH